MQLTEARATVRRALNDADATYWSAAEIDSYLVQGYKETCRVTRAIWDLRYAENLPRGFSYTSAFEAALATFDYGRANHTAAFERRLIDPEYEAEGPANHTSPFEAINGHLSDTGASTDIPATATLPATVSEIDRPLWDQRAIAVLTPRQAEATDSRYELTEGEVYAIVPTQQGLKTIRKVRVPSAQADTYTVEGSWGILRSPADCSSGTVSGSWGIPRRIPGHHAMGSESFGLPRRVYRDGKNVRIEHWREGRAVVDSQDAFELPDRAVVYLQHYAIGRCYAKEGPAQDLRLAAHYQARYARGVARLQRRVQAQKRARVAQFGGAQPIRRGPPRPSLPWQFGTVVR